MGMLPPLAPGVGVGPLTCCVPGVAILTQCAPPSIVRCNEPRPSAYPTCASAKTNCAPAGVSVLKSESYWWNCWPPFVDSNRSEEHTSELQSRGHLVCRLLLEKKKMELRRHAL